MIARACAAALLLLLAAPAAAAKKPLATGDRLDLNRASVAELMRLPQVGRSKAEAIAALRSRTPFRKIEDVLAVKGISPAWLDRNRAHLTAGPPPAAKPTALAHPK